MAELRITVPLTREEYAALKQRASTELRQPRDQARHMLRLALLHDPPDPATKNEGRAVVVETAGAPFFAQS